MSRKKRPSWITDEIKEAPVFCKDCDIEHKCGLLKEANRMSRAKGGNNVNHEWGCVWLQEKGK